MQSKKGFSDFFISLILIIRKIELIIAIVHIVMSARSHMRLLVIILPKIAEEYNYWELYNDLEFSLKRGKIISD